MNIQIKHRQQGAVLVIALVMLLVLTFLATSSMRGTALDARITANRIETIKQQNMAEAALREGEFRLYGRSFGESKFNMESSVRESNCRKNNILKVDSVTGENLSPPCLLPELNEDDLMDYFKNPIQFIAKSNFGISDIDELAGAGNTATLAWMPYRGLDPNNHYSGNANEPKAYWNVYRIDDGSRGGESENAHYTANLLSEGGEPKTMYFMVTGQANGEFVIQSTAKIISQ